MKTIFHSKILLLPIILIILIGGCCTTPENIAVSTDFKRYFNFPKGSYWIYKNQYNEYDTLLLESLTSKYIEYTRPESCSEYELVEISYFDSYLSLAIKANIKAESITFSSFSDNESFFPDLISDTTFLTFQGSSYTFNQDFIKELQIGDHTFWNIYSVEIDTTLTHEINNLQPISGYYVRDIGLIKRVLYDGTIWELIDYKINK